MCNNNLLNHVSICINSSYKTSDIAYFFFQGFQKNFKSNIKNKFWLTNDVDQKNLKIKNFELIKSNISNWKNETLTQLLFIKSKYPNISHIILILDDFIFFKPNFISDFDDVVNFSVKNKLKYVRFSRIEKSFLFNILTFFRKPLYRFKKIKFFTIPKNHPYYSSLQIALWDLDYLISQIKISKNIWSFENLLSNETHLSLNKELLFYKHIVEKGKWLFYAKSLLNKAGIKFEKGNRGFYGGKLYFLYFYLKKIQFFTIGYLPLRLKYYFNNNE